MAALPPTLRRWRDLGLAGWKATKLAEVHMFREGHGSERGPWR